MKRILFTALGAGLLLTSCQSDELMPGGIGSEQEVAFTVSLPDVASTRAGSVNSAKGGVSNNLGENVTFHVALYLDDYQVYDAKTTVTSTGNHTSATFNPTLVIGETYNVVAFAEFDADEDDASLKAVAVESGINNEKNDDYFVSTNLVAAPQLSAELKRPYGKLRLLADDLREAERQFNSVIKKVSVTYKETRPTEFNAVTGNFNNYVDGDQTFEADYTEYEEGSLTIKDENGNDIEVYEGEGGVTADNGNYNTIFVDYIPAAADASDQMMPFSIKVTFEDGNTYTRVFPQDIPIRRNWLTTLKGNLFTMDSELTLIIEENFDGETTQNFDENIEWIVANGGTLTLDQDIVLTKSLVMNDANANAVINLNGHTISFTNTEDAYKAVFEVRKGTLTINGEGAIKALGEKNIAVWAGRGDAGSNGKVIINGGDFSNETSQELIYAANKGIVEINAGTYKVAEEDQTSFVSPQYAVLNLYGNGKDGADIIVRGGEFYKFDPANNVSENPLKNFCAEGYVSSKVGDYYIVGKPASSVDEFDNLLDQDGVINVLASINNGTNYFGVNGSDLLINMNSQLITAGGKGTKNYAFHVFGSNVEVNDANIAGAGFAVMDGSNVTVNSGKIAASPGNSGRNVFFVTGNSSVTVNGGDYSLDRTSCYFVYVDAGSTCYIKGGNFTKPLANNASKDSFVNTGSTGTVVITGGTFNVDPTKWVPEGYAVTKSGKIWTVSAK